MRRLLVVALLASGIAGGSSSVREPELSAAARQGDVARVAALVHGGADVNARDEHGFTPLMAAVGQGVDVARLLVRAGADVNVSTASGWTTLMQAASAGHADAAVFLVDAGADVDARDRFAGTAIDVAQLAGHDDVVRLLRDRGSRGSGRSEGDIVCVERWAGSGFCGVIEKTEPTRFRLKLIRIRGCAAGCAGDADCSEGRPVGGSGGLGVADVISIRSWCLTSVGVSER